MPRNFRPILVVLAAFALLVPVQVMIEQVRHDHALAPMSPDEAPGLTELALTTGLGAARTFVNLSTWDAIERATEEREHYRVVALSRTALRLQPNNPDVLDFLARQLIFTISRTEADHKRAWEWVREGHDLLVAANRRNPYSSQLRLTLGSFYYQMMAEHPIHLLRADLAANEHGHLAKDRHWRNEAHELLAAYDALAEEERARLDHVIQRIGFNLVHTGEPRAFPEYALLSREAQRLYDELNVARYRMPVLVWVPALAPEGRLEGADRINMVQWSTTRLVDLLSLASRLPRGQRLRDQANVWRWAVRLLESIPYDEDERWNRVHRVAWSRLADAYDAYAPPANLLERDGVDLLAHYFHAGLTEPPPHVHARPGSPIRVHLGEE